MFNNFPDEHGFEVVHVGVNTADAEEASAAADLIGGIFGLEMADGKDSVFAGPRIELMKGGGRGIHGHIAVAVNDIHSAISFLESSGYELDHDAVKYNAEGQLILIYLKQEIAGFAFHLLQKERTK